MAEVYQREEFERITSQNRVAQPSSGNRYQRHQKSD